MTPRRAGRSRVRIVLLALLVAAAVAACDSRAPADPSRAEVPGDAPIAQVREPEPEAEAEPDAEPDAAAAVAVLREYYAAIDDGDYSRAWHLWSADGQASGQTLAGFRAGFADTARVSVEAGAPGRIEGAAGSRYVTVPVTVRATHQDGSTHRWAGSYVLRRAVVDGASPAQRAWRIASADLRELR